MTTQVFSKHRWRFFRAGALDQVRFEMARISRNSSKLDLKLWVALSCPTRASISTKPLWT